MGKTNESGREQEMEVNGAINAIQRSWRPAATSLKMRGNPYSSSSPLEEGEEEKMDWESNLSGMKNLFRQTSSFLQNEGTCQPDNQGDVDPELQNTTAVRG
jgi:hypothetical protein